MDCINPPWHGEAVVAHTRVTELKGQAFTRGSVTSGMLDFSPSQLNPSALSPAPR